jgi:hypothetical protein
MLGSMRFRVALLALVVAAAMLLGAANHRAPARAAGPAYPSVEVLQEGTRFAYVVFHAVDRDGFCDAAAFGAVSLHPVLTDAPNDTLINGATGLPNPRATLDAFIDSGDGFIIETNKGTVSPTRSVTGLSTFSTYANANLGSPVKAFPPLVAGAVDECQAWVKVASALGQRANVLLFFHDDTGDIGFDELVNGPRNATLTLTPRWSLVSWTGPDGVTPADALAGTGAATGGTNVTSAIGAIYAWDSAAAQWLAYFPGSGNVPGANTLASLKTGEAYWFAVSGSAPVQWTLPAAQ